MLLGPMVFDKVYGFKKFLESRVRSGVWPCLYNLLRILSFKPLKKGC